MFSSNTKLCLTGADIVRINGTFISSIFEWLENVLDTWGIAQLHVPTGHRPAINNGNAGQGCQEKMVCINGQEDRPVTCIKVTLSPSAGQTQRPDMVGWAKYCYKWPQPTILLVSQLAQPTSYTVTCRICQLQKCLGRNANSSNYSLCFKNRKCNLYQTPERYLHEQFNDSRPIERKQLPREEFDRETPYHPNCLQQCLKHILKTDWGLRIDGDSQSSTSPMMILATFYSDAYTTTNATGSGWWKWKAESEDEQIEVYGDDRKQQICQKMLKATSAWDSDTASETKTKQTCLN